MSPSADDKRSPAAAGKPALEELLRVKRAERPDDAFWEEFERGLRQKQLAAIIEPKPWWIGLSIWGRRFAPLGLPASVAAAALLAVMVVRTQSPFSPAAAPFPDAAVSSAVARADKAPRPAALASAPSPSVEAPRLADTGPSSPVVIAAVSPTPDSAPATSGAAPLASAASSDASTGLSSPPIMESLFELGSEPLSPTPSERTIAENLAVVRAEAPGLIAASAPLPADIQGMSSDESVIEPALKMEVRNPRHARVLLAMADGPAVEAQGGASSLHDHFARVLDREDALAGSARRLGVGGDRLSVSF